MNNADNTKINILSDEVVGKISAGEVVERPASVVKELVENSIDAGADSIEIAIESAGQSLIRVADNGEGMTPADAKVACRRHATSKIRDIGDLDRISTLGFRGEALSSIAAVSRMELTSRAGSDSSGVYLCVESGEVRMIRPAGRARGTTIEVRDLFYNVPARRKFLKKGSTELAEIVSTVGRFIVVYPGIEFKLTRGDRCLLHATKGMGTLERIRLALGEDVSDSMVDVSFSSGGYEITGFVSRPSNTRKDKRAQMFFVNGRSVRSRLLSDAVHGAYRSLLERGRYPAAVLFLTAPPSEVDVNVHPAKLQVKFGDERAVKDAVSGAIQSVFDRLRQDGGGVRPGLSFAPAPGGDVPESGVFPELSEVQAEFGYNFQEKSEENGLSRKSAAFYGSTLEAAPAEPGDMFQVGGCYIVRITGDGITITDQHAAHERVLYEFFSRSSESGSVETQRLLFPLRIDLSAAESVIMEKVIGNFRTLGFGVEPFGERSFIVQAAPAILKDRDIRTVIHDVLMELASCDPARIDRVDELVKLTSCRAAIKAGDALGREEMVSLLDQLSRCSLPFTCPHGRPTTTEITVDELEKRFRRK